MISSSTTSGLKQAEPKNKKTNDQAKSRVSETKTINEMVKRLLDELDDELKAMGLQAVDTDLQDLREQNKYARNNYIEPDDIVDVKFEMKIRKEVFTTTYNSKSRVCHMKTPKFAESAKTRVRNGKLFTKSRVRGIEPNGKLRHEYSNQVKMKAESPGVPQNLSSPRIIVPKKPPPNRDRCKMGHVWDQTIPRKGVLDIGFCVYPYLGHGIGLAPFTGTINMRAGTI